MTRRITKIPQKMRSFRLKVDSPNGVSLRLRSILQITYNILHHGEYTNQKCCLVKLGSHVCSRRLFKLILNISQKSDKNRRGESTLFRANWIDLHALKRTDCTKELFSRTCTFNFLNDRLGKRECIYSFNDWFGDSRSDLNRFFTCSACHSGHKIALFRWTVESRSVLDSGHHYR